MHALLRLVEKCSKPEDGETELEKFKEKFKERNYPDKVINEKLDKASKKDI